MQHQISVITLGITDLLRSRRFYVEGFGWTPVFENEDIIFYQMNGFVLGTFEKSALEKDMNRSGLTSPGAFSLAHNVPSEAEVVSAINQLVEAGGVSSDRQTPRPMAVFEDMWPIRTITLGR